MNRWVVETPARSASAGLNLRIRRPPSFSWFLPRLRARFDKLPHPVARFGRGACGARESGWISPPHAPQELRLRSSVAMSEQQ